MSHSRTRRRATALLLLAGAMNLVPSHAITAQQSAPSDDLARRVVAAAGGVRPGEMVVITGGPHTIPFMEAVAIEVIRAGGGTMFQLFTDRTTLASNREFPDQHLRARDTAITTLDGALFEHVDVYVNLPDTEDPDTLIRAMTEDTARMARVNAVLSETQERWEQMRNDSRTRFVNVEFPPTRSAIRRSGMDSASFTTMQWAAMTADYAEIERAGRALARLLEGGRTVHVTTPAGTDLRLQLAGRRAVIDAGVLTPEAARAKLAAHRTVSLPGGRVSVAPLETSVTGRVVLPRSRCPDAAVVNARLEFRDGKLAGYAADSGGSCVRNFLATSESPADLFGMISIGLNPGLRVVEAGLGYRPWAARGAVGIGVGNNTELGGSNVTPAGYFFLLTGATVEVDGTVIVRDGQLTSAPAGAPGGAR